MTKPKPLGIAPFDPAEFLKDDESIAEFLNASMEMNDPTVLLNAVGTVAHARSRTQLAEASGLRRNSASRPKTTKLGATARAKSEETSAKPRVTGRSTP